MKANLLAILVLMAIVAAFQIPQMASAGQTITVSETTQAVSPSTVIVRHREIARRTRSFSYVVPTTSFAAVPVQSTMALTPTTVQTVVAAPVITVEEQPTQSNVVLAPVATNRVVRSVTRTTTRCGCGCNRKHCNCGQ